MKSRALLTLLAVSLLASPAIADTLNGAGQWNPWVTPTQPNPTPFQAAAFWDNLSFDGTPNGIGDNCNVGFWVSRLGGCDAVNTVVAGGDFYKLSPSATPGFLGDGNLTSTFTLTPDGHPIEAQAAVAVSDVSGDVPSRGTTTLGWILTGDDPNDPTKRHPILDAGSPVHGIAVPSGDYALYIAITDYRADPKGQTTVFTSNSVDWMNRTHFAVFDLGGGHYAIGVEDTAGTEWADYDYNDLVLFVSTAVPEPATFLLVGMGLLAGAALRKRRGTK